MYKQQQRTITNPNRRNRRAYMDVNFQGIFIDNFVLPALKYLAEDPEVPANERLLLAYFNKLLLSYQ